MSVIPVLQRDDPGFESDFLAACRDPGFVALRGHGIAADSIAAMGDLLVRLFAVDDEAKRSGAITRDDYRGFIPLGFFTPNRPEASGLTADAYEGYKLHWECPPDHPVMAESALYGPNRWPDHLPEMASVVGRYWAGCDSLADDLLGILGGALGQDRAQFRSLFDAPLTNMTLLHYPGGDQRGFHAHRDTNVLTFLAPDPVGGLEIRTPDGGWVEADRPDDALLVNLGEMLELWSGGEFVATPHRVDARRERWSFPYFVVPNHAVVVEPLVPCRPGFARPPMHVGALSAEVWRTNWPDEAPSRAGHDLGTLDR